MVEVKDITEEQILRKQRIRLEKTLAEECFSGRRVKVVNDAHVFVYDNEGRNIMATKVIGAIKMINREKELQSLVEEFGRKYEEQFGLKEHNTNFIIETDYSKG